MLQKGGNVVEMSTTVALDFLWKFSSKPPIQISRASAGETMYKRVSKYFEAFAVAMQVNMCLLVKDCLFCCMCI